MRSFLQSVTTSVSIFLGVCLLWNLAPLPAMAKDLPPIRVGLSRALGGANALAVSSEAAMLISQGDNGKLIVRGGEGSTYRVVPCTSGLQLDALDGKDWQTVGRFPYPIVFACVDTNGLKIGKLGSGGLSTSTLHRYRGTISIRKRPDGLLSTVNTVDVEDYVYGVVAREMGGEAPTEALKAQAVASRTYVLGNRGRFASDGFDVDDSTRSQQYDGVDGETPATIAAVDDTRGKVLTYQGKLIEAEFSSDCGGVTAVDDSGEHPYFQAVVDSPGDGQPDYAATSSYHDWDCHFTEHDLVALLNKDPRTRVANFTSLSLDSMDASGRIKAATVSDNNGTMKTVTGPELRQILGYDTLRSTRVSLTVKANGDYVFHGHGWGHGFGMSQAGAAAMAAPPYNKSYVDILAHYYVGARIMDAGQ